jgi:lysylphosphatidylglycerol synthetase-like protein (DUF2156 family)
MHYRWLEKGFCMTHRPKTVIASYIFILLNALIWLILGIIIAVNAHPAIPDTPGIRWTFASLSIALSVIILILFFFLYRKNRLAYYLMLALFASTAVLTIFDDVGWSDLVVLALNIVPIVLLVIDRAWHLQIKPKLDENV